jgi:hypothetical protein
MAKATCAAFSARLGPSLKLTMSAANPGEVLFLLRRQLTPSAEMSGAAARVTRQAVDANGADAFQQVLDHLLELNERGELPEVPDGSSLPTVCEIGADGELRTLP